MDHLDDADEAAAEAPTPPTGWTPVDTRTGPTGATRSAAARGPRTAGRFPDHGHRGEEQADSVVRSGPQAPVTTSTP
ncbi:MAG: hypothetical protein QOI36_3711, partial [Pseudonocardiales bacterium]|nr:hypothetical protein [Pseudonocardiales bacterium]